MHCQAEALTLDPQAPIVLVGHPNVGKSVLFGALTGRYVEVSNFPGTTVEVSQGKVDGVTLLDTPGIQSLQARSDDERVTREALLVRPPRLVVQVADARNLRRSLLLTLQLAEFDCPFVLDLNLIDEANQRGITIDASKLGQLLGAEVVETIAVRKLGLENLRSHFNLAQPMNLQLAYDAAIEKAAQQIETLLPDTTRNARAIAIMCLAGDKDLLQRFGGSQIALITQAIAEAQAQYRQPLSYVITQQRLQQVDRIIAAAVRQTAPPQAGWAEWFGRIAVHPLWGWPILAGVLLGMYLFVGQLGAGVMVGWMEDVFFGKWLTPAATGVVKLIPIPLIVDLLVGQYGLITMAITYGFAIVLPIVLTFFLAFSFLEDSGYLPRLAVMLNRPFKAMGLNGKAVLPMVLGLGCDTMATLTTRILDTKRDRILVTLLLALGVPCSAQLGVLLGMMSYLSPAAIFVWVALVVAIMFGVGWLAAQVIPGQRSDFILELPPIRMPQLSNILIKTVARLEWYLKEVLPLFVLGTLVLFILDRTGLLLALQHWATPLVQGGLGLPPETTGAFIIGFLRRDYGAAGFFNLARAGQLTSTQLLISLVVITLFVPCIANVLIIVKEHGWKTAAGVTGFVFPFAFGVGMVLNLAFRALGVTF